MCVALYHDTFSRIPASSGTGFQPPTAGLLAWVHANSDDMAAVSHASSGTFKDRLGNPVTISGSIPFTKDGVGHANNGFFSIGGANYFSMDIVKRAGAFTVYMVFRNSAKAIGTLAGADSGDKTKHFDTVPRRVLQNSKQRNTPV